MKIDNDPQQKVEDPTSPLDHDVDASKNGVLRELGDLYEHFNPNNRPNVPRNQLEPKLNLFGCPFEHRVIPNKNLHPRIRAYIDIILKMKLDSRVNATVKVGQFAAILSPSKYFLILWSSSLWVHIGYSFSQKKRYSGEERDNLYLKFALVSGMKSENLNELVTDVSFSQRVNLFSIPYKLPNKHTKLMSKLIKEIVSNRESPFDEIDCDSLVREYHYGVIDNHGNMVLIKDPRDQSAKDISKLEMWLKLKQLKQPFQRAMFEIAKPEVKVKQEQSQTVHGAVPSTG